MLEEKYIMGIFAVLGGKQTQTGTTAVCFAVTRSLLREQKVLEKYWFKIVKKS